jgi:cation diffusion facilitator family transporter
MAQANSSPQLSTVGAALNSLIAATALTAFKIVVGLLTGSLGILAEAAHSGLDLVAALVTFLAVRISGKPADAEHTYGHGKVENLSALFESLLLLVTCVWIIYEAVKRLIAGNTVIEVNVWSFLVMATSIAIDVSRSRVLSRVAKQNDSQALEADALHFETDVWSSAVVILGLVCVKVAGWLPQFAWLRHADAIAALGVAAIVIIVSFRLGFRTVQALLDAAPAGSVAQIVAAAEAVPGVIDCHDVRVRHSGPTLFADAHVTVDGNLPLRDAHALTEQIESAVRDAIPRVDLVVHPEPAESGLADAQRAGNP